MPCSCSPTSKREQLENGRFFPLSAFVLFDLSVGGQEQPKQESGAALLKMATMAQFKKGGKGYFCRIRATVPTHFPFWAFCALLLLLLLLLLFSPFAHSFNLSSSF